MNIFRTTSTTQHPGILSAGVLYLCLLGLFNTIFFPTVQESLSRRTEVQVHSDSSLLEVIMETFFDVNDTDTDPHDDEDDLIEKEHYILPALSPVSRVAAFAERKKAPRIPYALNDPTLEKTTPPPKYS